MSNEALVEELLGKLDLDTKTRLLAGQDMWTLPALPEIGLASLVMSDGPVGVRGVQWSAEDPSIALPSPTALAATWDPDLARRTGGLLAAEARRKGVHVLLAPTVNLHRSPLGGRHFECYSEDPLLTGVIGAGFVSGVQAGGVGATVKHFVANDSETERLTVDVQASERTLRELYLAPFEYIVETAQPWGIMAAYNSVNGSTMSEHNALQNGVLRGEWGFGGFIVSDWLAARDTARAANGGLDVAMPGPQTVFGERLATAVRAGEVAEGVVDAMVRRVLLLAARVGALEGATAAEPSEVDTEGLPRELAARSFVLPRNENDLLPLRPSELRKVALIGAAAAQPRILGGGSATVFPAAVTSPLGGLRAALPDDVELTYSLGADPRTTLHPASDGFSLRAVARDAEGEELASFPLREASVKWIGTLPGAVDGERLRSVDIVGSFTPGSTGSHTFGLTGVGELKLVIGGEVVFDGPNWPTGDLVTAIMSVQELRFDVPLTSGEPVDVVLSYTLPARPESVGAGDFTWISFGLGYVDPALDADVLIEQAVAAAAESDVAIVVVGTTEEVESEGFDRRSLALPGRQDELVRRVVAANPRTVVVVNAGSPVELPWEVDAVLLTWFPGQDGGAALADVLLGLAEPGGRLPTTWPVRMADCPVLRVEPEDGVLPYEEGVFIGYRGWERSDHEPGYWFGHGLGYTSWEYVSAELHDGKVRVSLRNTGDRAGREVAQLYLSPVGVDLDRPARWLVGFASVHAEPGATVDVDIPISSRAASTWTPEGWRAQSGQYLLEISHSLPDPRLTLPLAY
ncbi:glycoside hydrolase family 3 C-terminal domain-containing protein [Amycolatopsis sp.]|uniref:glycoside hydrolase family 3 C-terminal domain-containing protein n=1 Tax=Amycolatopsis sp. TaxID=37632 RepID=UPI002E03C5B1|nr:glycoside hydrolase family 3 C-terminal domain-containing protein [Amycolatopsis sp.]